METTRETKITGISDSEQIVGWYFDNQLRSQSFLYNAGSFSLIDYPGVTYTFAQGINNNGQIVGYYLTPTHIYGFLDNGGSFNTLSFPNALTTNSFSINKYGKIVGNYLIDNSSKVRGYIYDNGTFISVDYPGSEVGGTTLTGINDFEQIVGFYFNIIDGRNHGFLYKDGSFSSIDDPRSAGDTLALGINNKGQIVGYSSSGSFLLDNTGTFSPIVCPEEGSPTEARGINNKGQIVGQYYVNGLSHGFIATPVPTPFTFTGFFSPISNPPVLNEVKAGQAIPVKFSLNGDQGLDVFAMGFPVSQQIGCVTNASLNGVQETVTAGGSSLMYNPSTDEYTYVWKTDKRWSNTCHALIVQLTDGTSYEAHFQFK
jgi:probable HAF family extracellular repeat protein